MCSRTRLYVPVLTLIVGCRQWQTGILQDVWTACTSLSRAEFCSRLCCAHYCHWALTCVPRKNESSRGICFLILHPPSDHQIPSLRTAVEVDRRPVVWKWAAGRQDFRRRFRETCTRIGNVSGTAAWL